MTRSTPLPPEASKTLSTPARPELTGGRRVGVLLSHGLTGNPVSIRPWGEYLAEQGYAVEVPLLPGHGTTWEDANTTTWADWYGTVTRSFDQLPPEFAALRVVVLEVVRLVEHDAGPGVLQQRVDVFAQDVVVDDGPAIVARRRHSAGPDDADVTPGTHGEDLAGDVERSVTNECRRTQTPVYLCCFEDRGVQFSVIFLQRLELLLELADLMWRGDRMRSLIV